MLVKLNFSESPNFKTKTLKSNIKTPVLSTPLPIKLNDILVRKKSFTTPSGKSQPIKLPRTPPIAAPMNKPIIINEIFLFLTTKV